MAIVKMNKFTLFTLQEFKGKLLDEFQRFQGVQFIDLLNFLQEEGIDNVSVDNEGLKLSQNENKLSQVKYCLGILEEYAEKEKMLTKMKNGKAEISYDDMENKALGFDLDEIYNNIKSKDDYVNELKNEKTKLEAEIITLQNWKKLDIGTKDYMNLKSVQVSIGTVPLASYSNLLTELENNFPNAYVEAISEEKNEVNIVVLCHKDSVKGIEEILRNFNYTKATFAYEKNANETIADYKNRIDKIELEQIEITNYFRGLKDHVKDLQIVYEYYSAEVVKYKSCSRFVRSEKTVAIEGWIKEESKEKFMSIVNKVCGKDYYMDIVEATDEEDIPIELKGNGFTEPFQSITEMYSLPNYREVDPTPVYSLFYVIFFGMMLSDAAYGLILTVATAVALKVFKLDKAKKNFAKLFLYLGISTTIWGLIYGSFFGDLLGTYAGIEFFKNPFINPQEDIMTILGMSVAFGIIHIFIALGVKAYVLIRDKKYFDVLADVVTWYLSVAGVLLWIGGPMIGGATLGTVGKYMTIVGFVGLLLTQGRDAASIGGKIGGGVYGLYGITSYVGDLVSYSRLLALGLATGFISNAFNLMIDLFPSPVKFTLGVVLFIGLHSFNLGINALGAYVHTSRLQYLEFFNKFYEGGGSKFSPLQAENKYLEVKEK